MRATNAPSRTQNNTHENLYEEEDEMRATQDNTKEEIQEEQDEMRTTNAPCCGSDTKDKQTKKGKWKSEKHGALCEAEHKKTKKKNRHKSMTNWKKSEKHRRTKVKQQPAALGQATKTPPQPVE